MTRTLIVAGATGYGVWPANTLEGCLECLSAPVDGIEIDVQTTADGHVVAHHDYWLSRASSRLEGAWIEDRGPPLKTLTLDELRRYDVGTLRPGSDYAARYPHRVAMEGVCIPTLPELFGALAAAPGPRRWFYIEIKTDPTDPEAAPDAEGVTRAVLADVAAADWADHTKIIAFDWRVLRLCKALAPDIATAHLTIPATLAVTVKPPADGDSPWADGFDPRRHAGSDLKAIHAHGGMEWSPYFTDVNEERVAEAAALGLKVGPWGLSAAEDIARMVKMGVFSATVSGPDWGPAKP
jgi:glycerophosphoryl diester phosphodiesterase